MSCPICNNTELSKDAESCPKCGSDLEIFSHIESLHKEDTFQKKSILVLTALFGLVVVSWGSVSFFSGSKVETASVAIEEISPAPVPGEGQLLTDAGKPVEEFVKENEVKPDADPLNVAVETPALAETPAVKAPVTEALAVKTPVLKEKPKAHVAEAAAEKGTIIHKVKSGDSFWKISKKYFGNGNHAKQIAADNNLSTKKDIPLGTKLKINK